MVQKQNPQLRYLGLGTQGRMQSRDSQTEWYPLSLLRMTAVDLQELAALMSAADGRAEAQQTHTAHSREERCVSGQLTQLGGGGEYYRPTAQDRGTSITWRLLDMPRLNVLSKELACAHASQTPPTLGNTHIILAMPHSWGPPKSSSHSGSTSLITPCFHAFIHSFERACFKPLKCAGLCARY